MNFTTAALEEGVLGEEKHASARFTSPSSPVGPSSAAVVKTNLRKEKILAGFGPTGHSEIHIQSR
jgi:hypothetical protein